MLRKIIAHSRECILALARLKVESVSLSKPCGAQLERRLAEYYPRLVRAIEGELDLDADSRLPNIRARPDVDDGLVKAAHAYVVIGRAIAETAGAAGIGAAELRALNRGLGRAIAEAAAARKETGPPAADLDADARMGFLVHELRNALSCVFVAKGMLKKAPGGAYALLERNLQHMRSMLDRAYSEVSLHKEPRARLRPMPVIEAVREVESTAGEDARRKGITLCVRVAPRLKVSADGEYLVSALANLVRNAVKFTRPGGTVWVRGRAQRHSVVLEVEDQCGGLPGGRIEALFEPFTQKGEDRSGLGLGLTISRRAIALNNGTLSARDIPGKGCVFSISLPKIRWAGPARARVSRGVTVRTQ